MSRAPAPPWPSLDALVHTPDLSPQAAHALRHFWESPPGGPGAAQASRRTLHVRTADLSPVMAGAHAHALKVMERDLSAHVLHDDLWLDDGQGRLHLHAARGEVHVAGDPGPEAWSVALTEFHRAGGWLPLHAAVLARAGSETARPAVAVTGVSGAGKSTATLRLAGAGYAVLAEDRAFWSAPTGQVAGLDRHLRAFEDSLRTFAPQLLSGLAGRDSKGKGLVPLPPAAPATLRELLLLRPEVSPLSSAERVRTLWELTGVPLTEQARAQVQAGVMSLLPLLRSTPVSRASVLEAVAAGLEP